LEQVVLESLTAVGMVSMVLIPCLAQCFVLVEVVAHQLQALVARVAPVVALAEVPRQAVTPLLVRVLTVAIGVVTTVLAVAAVLALSGATVG
jgi:hypothetical protein